jgi:hypothetical protein
MILMVNLRLQESIFSLRDANIFPSVDVSDSSKMLYVKQSQVHQGIYILGLIYFPCKRTKIPIASFSNDF